MLRKQTWLATTMWVALLLSACNLSNPPGAPRLGPTVYTKIEQVVVNPERSAGGVFDIIVDYFAVKPPFATFQAIRCIYLPPGGGEDLIDTIIPKYDEPYVKQRAYLSVTAREPGTYHITCRNALYPTYAESGSFVVYEATPTETIEPKVAAATATKAPASTITPTPKPESILGKITFDISGVKSSRPSPGGELEWVTKWCIPNVTITAEGEIQGICEYTGTTTHLTKSSVKVVISGSAGQGGAINFIYDVTERGPNGWKVTDNAPGVKITAAEAVWHIIYTGYGNFTSPSQAKGTADFSFSCDSGASNLVWCWKSSSESFAGTIPWSFESGQ